MKYKNLLINVLAFALIVIPNLSSAETDLTQIEYAGPETNTATEVKTKPGTVRQDIRDIRTETKNNIQQKRIEVKDKIKDARTEIKDIRTENKEMIKEKREDVKENIKQKIEERKSKIATNIKTKIENHAKNIIERIYATIDRVEKIVIRVESRIQKIKDVGSSDVTEAQKFITEAKTKIALAKTDAQGLEKALAEALLSETPRESFNESFKVIVQNIKQNLKDVRVALENAIKSIKENKVNTKPDSDNDETI